MKYFIKIPWYIKIFYPGLIWKIKSKEKELYLTFDDGPHPEATIFVLDQLQLFNAKATFFCIGENVANHPGIYGRIISDGHKVGNHSYTHPNGWEVSNEVYLKDVQKATQVIRSNMFRPPYGRMNRFQIKNISKAMGVEDAKIIMYDVLSADFDIKTSQDQCVQNVVKNAGKGSIVVFHDSEKAFPKLKYALPRVLEYFSSQGYVFKALPY